MLLQSSICWTLIKGEDQCIKAAEIRFLIPLVGVTRVDNVRNENTEWKPGEDTLIHEIRSAMDAKRAPDID